MCITTLIGYESLLASVAPILSTGIVFIREALPRSEGITRYEGFFVRVLPVIYYKIILRRLKNYFDCETYTFEYDKF